MAVLPDRFRDATTKGRVRFKPKVPEKSGLETQNDTATWGAPGDSGSDLLWQVIAGVLQPAAVPAEVDILTTRLVLRATGDGAQLFSDVATNVLTAAGGYINIGYEGTLSYTLFALDASGNATVGANADVTVSARTGAVLVQSVAGAVNLDALHGVNQPAPASLFADPGASKLTFYLDEAGNKLKVRVTYANGTTHKTGEIALT